MIRSPPGICFKSFAIGYRYRSIFCSDQPLLLETEHYPADDLTNSSDPRGELIMSKILSEGHTITRWLPGSFGLIQQELREPLTNLSQTE